MDDAKKQLADKLKTANNVLVTVSRNPSIDQLAACLGLTLLLNKQGKHTAAVFSGEVPSTLEFLQPEETLEKTTDSLRDFIIALDKSKADKLRYKVEDNIVRIFITPYKTSISESDLEFSQGDFNVDVVVALGVAQQEDLDEAITSHGRILHDATVSSINISQADGGLGTINWRDPHASSLSELVSELAQSMGDDLFDKQIATALLTGIVAETERFSNDKTSSQTMSISAALMAAGANQQLVASKLEESGQLKAGSQANGDLHKPEDGTIEIKHDEIADLSHDTIEQEHNGEEFEPGSEAAMEYEIPDNNGSTQKPEPLSGPKLVTEPPSMGGTLTANSTQETLDPANDPMGLPKEEPPALLNRSDPLTMLQPSSSSQSVTPPPANNQPLGASDHTLSELEESVKSTENRDNASSPVEPPANADAARDEISQALNNATLSSEVPPPPIEALNAQPLGIDLHSPEETPGPVPTSFNPDSSAGQSPATPVENNQPTDESTNKDDPNAPPPVPPPIPFQFGNPSPPQ